MRTAVDTSILLDVFLPDPKFGLASKEALKNQLAKGSLIICEMVYGELSSFFATKKQLDETLHALGIQFVSSNREVCYRAGELWKKHRKLGGSRQRVLADFFVAAHSGINADGLLTRDRGFYRQYFSDLFLIEP